MNNSTLDQLLVESNPYPVRLNIEYPEKLKRFSTFFRLFYAIPSGIIIALLTMINGTGLIFFPLLLTIPFYNKYPRWWYDWNLQLARFQMRITSYIFLLRDEYPSIDEEQAIHLDFEYPEEGQLNRFLPFVKWLLIIPHYICLAILLVPVMISIFIAWFAILLTGKYPRFLFNFVVGWLRWSQRAVAYAMYLTTDKYPPFSLKA